MTREQLRNKFESRKIKTLPAPNVLQKTEEIPKSTCRQPSPEECSMQDIIKRVVGTECAGNFESYYKLGKGIKPHIATVFYKEWAQGVAHNEDLTGATANALKLIRKELIDRRNKLNIAIDRLQI